MQETTKSDGDLLKLSGKVIGPESKVTPRDGKVEGFDIKEMGHERNVGKLGGKMTGPDENLEGLDGKVTQSAVNAERPGGKEGIMGGLDGNVGGFNDKNAGPNSTLKKRDGIEGDSKATDCNKVIGPDAEVTRSNRKVKGSDGKMVEGDDMRIKGVEGIVETLGKQSSLNDEIEWFKTALVGQEEDRDANINYPTEHSRDTMSPCSPAASMDSMANDDVQQDTEQPTEKWIGLHPEVADVTELLKSDKRASDKEAAIRNLSENMKRSGSMDTELRLGPADVLLEDKMQQPAAAVTPTYLKQLSENPVDNEECIPTVDPLMKSAIREDNTLDNRSAMPSDIAPFLADANNLTNEPNAKDQNSQTVDDDSSKRVLYPRDRSTLTSVSDDGNMPACVGDSKYTQTHSELDGVELEAKLSASEKASPTSGVQPQNSSREPDSFMPSRENDGKQVADGGQVEVSSAGPATAADSSAHSDALIDKLSPHSKVTK